MGLAWYLLATMTIGAGLRCMDLVRLRHLVDAVTLPGVRRLVAGAVGVSVGAASLVATASQAGAVAGHGRPPATPVPAFSATPVVPGSGPVMIRLPPGRSAAPAPGRAELWPGRPPESGQVPMPRSWVARPGDNLWSMAEANLARAWQRPPTDPEVDRYWLRLIEANRYRLADPANPDLIFPGQVFDLPPP